MKILKKKQIATNIYLNARAVAKKYFSTKRKLISLATHKILPSNLKKIQVLNRKICHFSNKHQESY